MQISFDPTNAKEADLAQNILDSLHSTNGLGLLIHDSSLPPGVPQVTMSDESLKAASDGIEKAVRGRPRKKPVGASPEPAAPPTTPAPPAAGGTPLEQLGAGPVDPAALADLAVPAAPVPAAPVPAAPVPAAPVSAAPAAPAIARSKENVRTLLAAFAEKNGKEKAIKLLQDKGKANKLSDVQPLLYGDLITAAGMTLAEAETINAAACAKAAGAAAAK